MWKPPSGDTVTRASTALVVVGIGAVAALVSYRHAYELALAHGEIGLNARLMPLTIDGLVYVASMVMLDSARRNHSTPALAKWSLATGIGATLAANVMHGYAHGLTGAVISAWPAVALVFTFELAMGMIRRSKRAVVAPEPAPAEHPLVPIARERFADVLALGNVPSVRKIMRELRVGYPNASRVHNSLETVGAE